MPKSAVTSRSALTLAVLISLGAGAPRVMAHDRPHGPTQKTRSAVLARHGMAATS